MPDEPTIDSRRVRRAFDRAAASYDTQAVVQREVATRLLERLQLVKLAPRLALDLGSGTGFVARGLRERYSEARVVAVDSSFAMLAASGRGGSLWRRLRAKGNYARVVGAMEQLPVASECADLICSNLALEWSAAPRRVFAEVHRCLRADGLFMFTTVGPATLRELKRACPDVSLQPTADMHDIGDALVRAGFASPVLDMELINVTYAELSALLGDIRRTGSTSAAHRDRKGLRGRSWLQALTRNYEQMRAGGRLPATVEVIYGHCWKAPMQREPRTAATEAVIRFRPRAREP